MANDFRIILKYAVKVFKKEQYTKIRGEKEYISWTFESDVEKVYEDYKKNNSADTKIKLAGKIYNAYGSILTNVDRKNIGVLDDLSTLTEVVGETLNGKFEYNFDNMLKNYVSQGGTFLMYFHNCVGKKYLSARSIEARADELGSSSFNKSGWAKVKKINAEATEIFGRKAEKCTDDMLEIVCDSLNKKGIFNDITVEKARDIISKNTWTNTGSKSNTTTNEDVDMALKDDSRVSYQEAVRWENAYDFYSEESEENDEFGSIEIFDKESSSNTEAIVKLGEILNQIKVTETNRYYFNVKIMYEYMHGECAGRLNYIRPVYCGFVKVAVWLNEKEKTGTRKICSYMHDFAVKNRAFPSIGNVAKDVLELKSSSQLNHAYNNVMEKIQERMCS